MSLRDSAHGSNMPSRLSMVALLLLAVGLQFQVVIPLGPAGLKICPADAVAALFTVQIVFHKWNDCAGPLCRSRTLPHWLAICTMGLTLSFAIGVYRLGHVSSWALGSKLLGWGVLIMYLACGVFVGSFLGNDGRRRLARFLIYACVSTGLLSALLSVVLVNTRVLPQELTHFPLRGFVDNRNALIFLQMSALSLIFTHSWTHKPFLGVREREILCGACATVIVYTGSRSGLPAAAVVLLFAVLMGGISPRSLCRSALYALAFGLALELARDLMLWIMQLYDAAKVETMGAFGAGLPPFFINPPRLTVHDTTAGSSDIERLGSFLEALDLWRQAPIFGYGLGTALEASIAKHGTPLIIHNTALWLLAETGVVGLVAFAGLGWTITRSLFPLRADDEGACFRLTALLMLVMFVIMSLAHEMLYQRVLWLMLGLALAIPRSTANKPCAE